MPNSVWTESGTFVSIVPTTTTIDTGTSSQQNSVDYLTNADKIALLAQYAEELATKTALDTLASTWSVSSTFYNNAVAAISTALITAGAPANWATAWPDGTTSGPWTGIKTTLGNLWSQVATQRTGLQSTISNAQAAAAQATAIATSASNTISKLNVMALTAPSTASWASTSKPTLPNGSYAAGTCWLSTDGFEFQVNADGTAWETVTVAATGLFGQIVASQLTLVDTTNLCQNPSWVNNWSSWVSQNPASNTIATTGRSVHGSVVMANGGGTYAVINSNNVPCNAGDTYYAEAWFNSNGITSGAVSARIGFLNSSGGYVGSPDGNHITNTGGVWTLSSVSAVVPSGAVSAHIEVISWSPVGSNVSVADCFFRKQSNASMIVDGTITASKIATGAITADMITTGTLNAANVAVTNLNASNITTGTLSATNVLFPDGSQLSTASRVLSSSSAPSGSLTFAPLQYTGNAPPAVIPGFGFSLTAASTADTFNVTAVVLWNGLNGNQSINLYLCVDGVTGTQYRALTYPLTYVSTLGNQFVVYVASLTGLSAGAHTIQIACGPNTMAYPTTLTIGNTGSYALCQRIF
jgi:hypothetical protein